MARTSPRRGASRDRGILERLDEGSVLGDGGYLLELEKRGYVQAGPLPPGVLPEHPAAVKEAPPGDLDAGLAGFDSPAPSPRKGALATAARDRRVGGVDPP